MPEHEVPPDEKRAAPGYVADILKQTAEDAAERVAARNLPPGHRRARGWLAALAVALVMLSAWNTYRVTRDPVVATPAEELVTARFTMYLVAEELETYRRVHGTLPATLEAIDADEEAIVYRPRGSDFTLTAEVAGQTLTYISGANPLPFWSAAEELPQGGTQ
jgi:hypothetical protein